MILTRVHTPIYTTHSHIYIQCKHTCIILTNMCIYIWLLFSKHIHIRIECTRARACVCVCVEPHTHAYTHMSVHAMWSGVVWCALVAICQCRDERVCICKHWPGLEGRRTRPPSTGSHDHRPGWLTDNSTLTYISYQRHSTTNNHNMHTHTHKHTVISSYCCN